jgi:hypothetical protein
MAAADETARDYFDNELGRAADEADASEERLVRRMALVRDYRDQLVGEGFSPAQADAAALLHAVGAERFAPLRGETPEEYLERRLAGFFGMPQEEFEGLRLTPEDAEREAMFEQLMADMGVTPGMSKTARRRALQPEFAYAFGRVSRSSFETLYGKSVARQMVRQFGPRFFPKKGEGVPLDVLAMEFASQERGGYFNAGDVDAYDFAEKIMMPHDEFEANWLGSMGGALYQAAMSRAPDASVSEFARRVSTTEETRKTYFEMNPGQGVLSGQSVILPADSIRHRNKKHPDMTDQDMDRLPQVLDSLTPDRMRLPKKDVPKFKGKGMLAGVVVEGQAYGLILESVRPDRMIIGSYFKDTEKAVRAWLEQSGDAKKAVTTPAALWQPQAPEGALREQPSSGTTLPDAGEKGKSFEQHKSRGARGAIRQLDDGRWLVGLFQSRDLSTIVHETGHFFMEQLREAAGLADAPEWVGESWAKLQKAYGFEGFPSGESWTKAQERFATDFEAYMREGKAPSHELRAAFERFRDWLTSVYRTLKELLGDNELGPEVREVFDRLLASDEEIKLSRQAAEMADPPAGVYDAARMNVHGEPRRILLNAFELAVDDIANGRPVDVGRVAGLREAIGRAAGAMGREDFTPDFTPEAPEVFTPAPERPAVNSGERPTDALLREQGIGQDGVSLEERMAPNWRLAASWARKRGRSCWKRGTPKRHGGALRKRAGRLWAASWGQRNDGRNAARISVPYRLSGAAFLSGTAGRSRR